MVRRPPVSEQSTIVTPVESDPCRLMLQVEYFNTSIDLIQLRGLFEPAQLIDVDPLTVKWQGNSYAVIFRFGAVVFWRWSEKLASELAARISEVQELPAAVEQASDNLAVRVGQPEDSVNFRDICLHTLTVEHIRIVSQSLAQSAALKHCEVCVADALSNIEPFISDLRDHGRLPPSSQEVFKRIGFTLTMRQTILSRLTMFDPPAETWSSQRLDRLHAALYEHFDISSRLATLEAKLDFLADLNQILTNLLQHSESRRLELVVILLIIAEVALAVYDFFIRSH